MRFRLFKINFKKTAIRAIFAAGLLDSYILHKKLNISSDPALYIRKCAIYKAKLT